MTKRFSSNLYWLTLHFLLLTTSLLPVKVFAQPEACLADVNSAASGDLGYRFRNTRCEGALKLFVANSSGIDIVGFHATPINFLTSSTQELSIVALGGDSAEPIYFRAESLTSRGHYQMDHADAKLGKIFKWSTDILKKASSQNALALDVTKLGVVACNHQCVDRPDTTYWPVALVSEKVIDKSVLYLLLRSGVRANNLTIKLQSSEGKNTQISPPKAVLTQDGVTTISIPNDLPSGVYKLTVDARSSETREPLGALYGNIFIPNTTVK